MPAELATSLTSTDAERLEEAEGLVRDYCGWHIAPEREDDIVLDGTGNRILPLPSLHVVSVEDITDDGRTVAQAEVDVSASGYIKRSCAWTGKPGGITLTLTHGYETVPPGVASIVKRLAQIGVSNPGGAARIQDGPFSEAYGAMALTAADELALGPYRILP